MKGRIVAVYFSLQGKGRMATYWLLGEKPLEADKAPELTSLAQNQLVPMSANTPSIVSEMVEDAAGHNGTSLKIEEELRQKGETVPLLAPSGNGSTHQV